MALTDTTVRLAKPDYKDRKLADERGLYLLVTASGSKLWRFKFRIGDKDKKLSLGEDAFEIAAVVADVSAVHPCPSRARAGSMCRCR